MVYTVYHPEKLQTIGGLIPQAKPFFGGQAQKARWQTTGRGRQSPYRITLQIMFKVILTIAAPKNTWEKFPFSEPMCSGPGDDNSF